MLRITTSKNGSAAVEYFNKALSKQDYYADEGNVAGLWKGKAAEKLNLKGEVTKEQFEKLVNNRVPNSKGEDIKLTPKDSVNRRAGYDFTFNAPKSVSVAYAVGKDPKLLAAHQTAVSRAMSEIENSMQCQSSKRGENYVDTKNALWAVYDHFLSRPVGHEQKDGSVKYIPEPHLHSHSFLFNATYEEKREKFKAVEVGNIRKDAPYFEAYYHAVFRQEVLNAGYEIERTKDRWELKLVDEQLRKDFSNRTKEIKQAAIEKGITNAKAAEKIGAWTRQNKNKSVDEKEVQKDWNSRLSTTQKFNINSAAGKPSIPREAVNKKEGIKGEEMTPEKAVQLSLDHNLQNKSSVAEKRVLADAMNRGHFTPEQIQNAYDQRSDIFGYKQNTRRIITNRETLNAEKSMIRHASSEKGKYKPLNADYKPVSDNKKHDLNEGQKSAVKDLLNSKDGIMVLKGGAGTGKTTISKQIREGVEEKGKSMFAFAPSTQARDELKKAGFEAHTVKKLLDNQDLQNDLKDQVIYVDESGMIGVKTMNSIFEIGKAQNSRIILSGDSKQHNSVEAGDAQSLIVNRCQIKPAVVSEVVRQKKDDYKKAVEDLAQGKVKEGFKKLQAMGAVQEIEDDEKRYEQLADDYIKSVTKSYTDKDGQKKYDYAKRKGLVVSPTHGEGKQVNDLIRQKLKERNLIQGKERSVDTLRPLHYSEAQKQDGANFEKGMTVKVHYNTGQFKAGSECEVVGRDEEGQVLVKMPNNETPTPLPIDKFDKFSVYQSEKNAFAVGDTIQLTSNIKSSEGMALNNGNRYRIKSYNQNGDKVLSNGATLPADTKFIKHGIYSTSISAQGKTADDVFIAQKSAHTPANNQKQFYVSASRGSQSVKLYTDDAKELMETISQNDGSRESASHVAAKHKIETAWRLAVEEVDTYNKNNTKDGITETKTQREETGYAAERWAEFNDRTANAPTPTSPSP